MSNINLFQTLKNRIDNFEEVLWDKEIVLKRNEYLKTKGSRDTNLYYIAQGSLRILLETESEEITFRFGYTGNFISALDSYLTECASPFSIQAIKKCQLKVIKKSVFTRFIESNTENLMLWQQLIQGVIIDQGERELDLLTQSPAERYARVLKRSPQLFQLIPAKYIASYLRMTPETLSRIRKS